MTSRLATPQFCPLPTSPFAHILIKPHLQTFTRLLAPPYRRAIQQPPHSTSDRPHLRPDAPFYRRPRPSTWPPPAPASSASGIRRACDDDDMDEGDASVIETIPVWQRLKIYALSVVFGAWAVCSRLLRWLWDPEAFCSRARDNPPPCLVDGALGQHSYVKLKVGPGRWVVFWAVIFRLGCGSFRAHEVGSRCSFIVVIGWWRRLIAISEWSW